VGRVVLAALGISATLIAACAQPYTFHGSVIDPPVPAMDFTLTTHTGQPFQLSAHADRVTLLFFGYTHCPDACPATLAQFKQIHTRLGERAARVNFILITVDPARDTPQRLAEYLAGFNSAFLGLTGTDAELESVWRDYGIFRELRPLDAATAPGHTHTDGNYEVDHTTRLYALDAQGQLRLTYTADTSTDDLMQDVQHLLNE
jgi:protein SCO1/2